MPVEKRVDPTDGAAYTLDELITFYKGTYKKKDVEAYFENQCTAVKKGKGKAKAEPKGKAKAEPKAKGKAEPKAKAKAKAKGKPEAKPKPLGKPAAVGQSYSMGPVDVSAITKVSKDDLGLLPQPPRPRFKTALVGVYVRSQPFGGSDKSTNGHRYDTIPIANGMIAAGMSCQLIHYVHDEHDAFFELCKSFDAIIVRCNPGQIKADGGDQGKFDDGMRGMRKLGIQVWPSPDVMEFMGAKDALCKIATLHIGLPDTLAYYTAEDFSAGFKKTMKFQPRVIKQNRGSSGEGIWIIKLKSGEYCKEYGDALCTDDEKLDMMEANDNHSEEHTVAEFIEFCVSGRNSKSGEWTSKGEGKYLEGGKEAGGQLVDQRFCPRIVEGELRYNLVGDQLVGIIHKKPKEGGISAVGGTGSVYTFYGPQEKKFASLTKNYLSLDLPKIMPALDLSGEPIPLWWTTDFINSSPPGTAAKDEKWIVGEFNCSCVGISKCLPAFCQEDKPDACFTDIPKKDLAEAQKMGNLMGEKGMAILIKAARTQGPPAGVGESNSSGPVDVSAITKVAKDDLGLLPQPPKPKFKTALVGIYVKSQPFGGSDKSSNGHRYDTIPIANGMIRAGMSCQLIHYVHDEHAKFFELCKSFDAIIVRCNPGQIKADGGDQGKFDDGMRAVRKAGIQVWPSPDVMEFMGAKDALCKIATLHIGLPDTLAYYTAEEFSAGFKKTMKFQPRVIKQNRGSSGEGIWIIKLKSGEYCKEYGDALCTDDEKLDMMEANDNHSEEHTVAEFIEFCLSGRNSKSGEWTSKGEGKYLEGGKEAGGQLVDQRFCPRIVEGELRYNLVGDQLVGIIHKKPKEGGISAVGGTGSVYTFYGPKEKKFASLTKNYLSLDLPKIMPALGLSGEPIPLWWTTDFINSSPPGTAAKDEKWIVGEFNCSCVGISKCLPAFCQEDTPEACYTDIPTKDLAEAKRMGDLMGKKGLAILSKVTPKLGYWAIRGLAAPLRMMLAYGGIEATDHTYSETDEWFGKDKPALAKSNPLVSLPYYVDGDLIVTQSNAIALHIARKVKMAGRFKQQSEIEILLGDIYDLRNDFVDTMYWSKGGTRTVSEFETKKKGKFFEEKVKPYLDKYETCLSKRGNYLAGDLSAADFFAWEMVDQLSLFAKDAGQPNPIEGKPLLKAWYDRFRALDKLQAYFESDAYKLPCNFPGISFWSGPGAAIPKDAPK